MSDLVVIVPSRGRPQAAAELADAFVETCTAKTELLFAVDAGDPTGGQYRSDAVLLPGAGVMRCGSRSMVDALNEAATYAARTAFAVGFMGDDHRPRTRGWDQAYLDALWELGTGIVYGNDLLQGENLATQCAMTSDIIRTLGYMAPPTLRHLYVDNFWMTLGREVGCLRYLPNVVVEHMHPIAGKAEWSEGHKRVNTQTMYTVDGRAWEAYAKAHLAEDIEAVKALRS
jgi:hypothetical protein